MAMSVGEIEATLTLRDEMSRQLGQVLAQFKSFTSELDVTGAKLQRMGSSMQSAGSAMSLAITAPLGLATAAILRAGVTFETEMNKIQGVLVPTAEEMEAVRDRALEMGAATQFSASDAATAMLELGKAGLTTADAMAAVDETMQLASASGFTMQQSAEMSARTMNMFGMEVTDLAHINDVLATAVNKSSLELGDLQVAFGYIGPVAQGFNLSIEEVTAALAIMRDRGVAAETTGRSLREAFANMANPVGQTTVAMQNLGIESFKTSTGALMPLGDILDLLNSKGFTAADSLQMFGNAAGPAMFQLVTQGSGALGAFRQTLEDTEGSAKAMADAMMQGLPGAFEKLKGSVDTAMIAISKALEPFTVRVLGLLEKMADLITTKLVPAFEALPMPIQAATVALVAFAAAAGPVLFTIGSMTKLAGLVVSGWVAVQSALFTLGNTLPVLTVRLAAMEAAATWMPRIFTMAARALGLLTGPWGWLAAAVAALIPLLWDAVGGWEGLSKALGRAWQFIKDVHVILGFLVTEGLMVAWEWLKKVWDVLSSIGSAITGAVMGALRALLEGLREIPIVGALWEGFLGVIRWVKDEIMGAVQWIGKMLDAVKQVADAIRGVQERPQLPGPPAMFQRPSAPGLPADMADIDKKLPKLGDANRGNAAGDEEAKAWRQTMNDIGEAWMKLDADIWNSTRRSAESIMTLANATRGLGNGFRAAAFESMGLTKEGLIPSAMNMDAVRMAMDKLAVPGKAVTQSMRVTKEVLTPMQSILKDTKAGFVDLWKGMSGGKGIAGAIGTVGKGLAEGFGNLLSGGISSAISMGIGLLGKGIGKLFGSEGKKVNDERDSFIAKQFGTSDNLRKLAADAGVSLDKFFNAKKVKDYEAAVAELQKSLGATAELLEKYNITWADFQGEQQTRKMNEAVDALNVDFQRLIQLGVSHEAAVRAVGPAYVQMGIQAVQAGKGIPPALAPVLLDLARMGQLTREQTQALLGLQTQAGPTFDEVVAAADRWGLKLDELGPKIKQLQINDAGKKIADDFKLLTEAGAPTREVLAGMEDKVDALVLSAVDAGLEIPAAMRPVLEAMVHQGLLTDAAGVALTELSSIKFADPLISETDRLIDKLEELIDTMRRIPGLGSVSVPSAGDIQQGLADVGGAEIPAYASGGMVENDGLIRAHAGEAVLNVDAVEALNSGQALQGSDPKLTKEVTAMRQDISALAVEMRGLKDGIGRALRDQLMTRGLV